MKRVISLLLVLVLLLTGSFIGCAKDNKGRDTAGTKAAYDSRESNGRSSVDGSALRLRS